MTLIPSRVHIRVAKSLLKRLTSRHPLCTCRHRRLVIPSLSIKRSRLSLRLYYYNIWEKDDPESLTDKS
jgi:hypothetical protein